VLGCSEKDAVLYFVLFYLGLGKLMRKIVLLKIKSRWIKNGEETSNLGSTSNVGVNQVK